jgi:electron transfer flavoprotein alpha subunit
LSATTIGRSGVLVLAEVDKQAPASSAYELLGLGRRLSEGSPARVSAVILGSDLGNVDQELVFHGADEVYVADDRTLVEYQPDYWLSLVLRVVEKLQPALVLLGHTSIGSDLGPRLAFRLGTAVATDCEDMRVSGGKVMATRSCYGGKARAIVSFRTSPAVATITPKCQERLKRESTRNGKVIKLAVGSLPSNARTSRLERHSEQPDDARLESAKIVVAGGRGLNGAEGFRLLENLAEVLDASVGASRVACDLGWCPPTRQIGLTGKVVTPDLYVAVGISGASQHMAGCGRAKTIVAINTDPDANIFKAAQLGVVADYRQVVACLIEDLKQLGNRVI